MSKKIEHCELCGREIEYYHRRKIQVEREVKTKNGNGEYRSWFKPRTHAIICERCARKFEQVIYGMIGKHGI